MNVKDLSKPLSTDQIDFRIQSINNGKYATILAYKDARADMNRLDEVVGVLNWKREHTRDNKNCIVSVWCDEKKQWISKEDTGSESMAEAQKGLASDSFKRACFNLGIGRELYDYPMISIRLNADEVIETGKPKPKYRGSFSLNINSWKWETEFENNTIVRLRVTDSKGVERFAWAKTTSGVPTKPNAPQPTVKPKIKKMDAAKKALANGKVTVSQLFEKYDLTLEQIADFNEVITKKQ